MQKMISTGQSELMSISASNRKGKPGVSVTYRKKDSCFYALCLLSLPIPLVPLVLHFINQPIKVDLLQYGVTGHDKEMLIVWNPGALSLRCGGCAFLVLWDRHCFAD